MKKFIVISEELAKDLSNFVFGIKTTFGEDLDPNEVERKLIEAIESQNHEERSDEYLLLDWPEYQDYMEHPDWEAETSACMNENYPSAVFVPAYIIAEIDANDGGS